MPIASSAKAREMAAKGHEARREKRRLREIGAQFALEEFGSIKHPSDVKRATIRLAGWAASGTIPAAACNAATRSLLAWLTAYKAGEQDALIAELTAKVEQLEGERRKR